MSSYSWSPLLGGSGGVKIYSTLASFPSAGNFPSGTLAVAADTGILYEDISGVWTPIAGPGSALSLGNLDAQSATAKGAALVLGVLSMQSADATHPGLINNAAQTLSGVKTFSSILNADAGIDRSTSGTLTIGATNSSIINIGNSGSTVNIQGTTIYENTPHLLVADPLITVNSGGGTGSGQNSGIEVEEAGSITGYNETSSDRNSWILKAPNTAGIATITPGASGITLNQSSHNPVTIGTANGLSLATQALSLALASTSTTGALSSTDWNTFNNKQSTLTLTNLTDVGTDGIVITNGTGAVIGASPVTIAQTKSDATHNGYLSSTDWSTFNSKQQAITLAAVGSSPNANGASLSSGTLNLQPADNTNPGVLTSGTQTIGGAKTFTLGINTPSVTTTGQLQLVAGSGNNITLSTSGAGAYVNAAGSLGVGSQSATLGGRLEVQALTNQFRIRNSSSARADFFTDANGLTTITMAGTGAAMAITGGTTTVDNLIDSGLTASTALIANGSKQLASSATTSTELGYVSGVTSAIQTQLDSKQTSGSYITALTGDATATGPGSAALTLATVNSNVGSFGSSTSIPTFTVNAKGLITAASGNVVIAPAGTLTGTNLASNVVTSSLTSVGTITSGTWTGTTIATANGGTGLTSPGSSGNVLTSNGSVWVSSPAAGGTPVYAPATIQKFTSGSGTYNKNYTFIITSGSATVGATYTNNSITYTVFATVASATQVVMSGSGAPTASGTLTKASGTGDSTLTFSSVLAPLYLRVKAVGGGGGGCGSGSGSGTGTAGGTTTFGSSLLTCTGGGATGAAPGTGTVATPAYGSAFVGGAGCQGMGLVNAAGGAGGVSPFGGGGAAGRNSAAGGSAQANTGSGGGAAGATASAGSDAGGSAGGYVDAIIPTPSATYAYAVGAAGSGGTAGSGGQVGGAGAAGYIEITECYQ